VAQEREGGVIRVGIIGNEGEEFDREEVFEKIFLFY